MYLFHQEQANIQIKCTLNSNPHTIIDKLKYLICADINIHFAVATNPTQVIGHISGWKTRGSQKTSSEELLPRLAVSTPNVDNKVVGLRCKFSSLFIARESVHPFLNIEAQRLLEPLVRLLGCLARYLVADITDDPRCLC